MKIPCLTLAASLLSLSLPCLATLSVKSLKFSITTPSSDIIRSDTLSPQEPPLPTLSLSAADILKVSFTVEDDAGKGVQPVQSFFRLWDDATGEEGTIPFKISSAGKARFELNMRRPPALLPPTPTDAPMNVSLLLALPPHSPLEIPIFQLQLPLSQAAPVHPEEHLYHPQPEIAHTFRADEKVPPRIISAVGAGTVFVPWAVLLYTLSKLRPSLSYATSPSLLLFVALLGMFEALLVKYWVDLTLGQVLMYGAILGGATIIVGAKALNARKFMV